MIWSIDGIDGMLKGKQKKAFCYVTEYMFNVEITPTKNSS